MASLPEALHRSYLYAPGSRPDLMEKALVAGADVVVLDLEDAVAPGDKAAARAAVATLLRRLGDHSPCPVEVRINRHPGGLDLDDLEAVITPGLSAVRVPKASSPAELGRLSDQLAILEAASGVDADKTGVTPVIESAAGVADAFGLARAPRVTRLAFGATDFLADIASPGDPSGPATLFARSELVIASRLAGIGPPIDSVHTRLDDEAGLRRSALAARELGFFGKSVIHPLQLGPVHEVFTPSAHEVEHASQILAQTVEAGGGAYALDGELVDPAVVARARATLALVRTNDPLSTTRENDGHT